MFCEKEVVICAIDTDDKHLPFLIAMKEGNQGHSGRGYDGVISADNFEELRNQGYTFWWINKKSIARWL